ncbi:MAG: Fic family protein [Deltaproteobacteria bacterium]|nr:Fic family protein [Deltaproteobacteria bacterium]
MREYERTHSWLKFAVSLAEAPPAFWFALGECQSKCEHIAGVPLRPATRRRLHQIYLAKGSLASAAIEGNTLTEEEVLGSLEGRPPRDAPAYMEREVRNIIDAANDMIARLEAGEKLDVTPERIRELNRIVLRELDPGDGIRGGELRTWPVHVGGVYRGVPHADCEFLVRRMCEFLGDERTFEPNSGMEIAFAILRAIIAHVYLVWIHPFGDGNGRTARLLELQILIGAGVPAPAAHLLSNHYNQTRPEYYRQLDRASKNGGDLVPFIEYSVEGLCRGLRAQLAEIREQQWDVAWRSFVHEEFRDRNGKSDVRRRRLVLDLSMENRVVPLAEVPRISVRVAAEYARTSGKTLSRDLNALEQMGLIEKTRLGVRARKETILAFLPFRAP